MHCISCCSVLLNFCSRVLNESVVNKCSTIVASSHANCFRVHVLRMAGESGAVECLLCRQSQPWTEYRQHLARSAWRVVLCRCRDVSCHVLACSPPHRSHGVMQQEAQHFILQVSRQKQAMVRLHASFRDARKTFYQLFSLCLP